MSVLNSICRYRNETVDASEASIDTYVSTENLLPNKNGVSKAASIPNTGKVKVFHKGDTLVSNIRPYFKKIWLASRPGTCSQDILVFEPIKCTGEYLYWILSDDSFFDYITATSKGTKMPRGDKTAIMMYSLKAHSSRAKDAIVSVLEPIQAKIALNNRLNDCLAV